LVKVVLTPRMYIFTSIIAKAGCDFLDI